MKMSGVFKGNVFSIYHDDKLVSLSDESGKFCLINDCAKREVITAINNHDALVEALEFCLNEMDSYDFAIDEVAMEVGEKVKELRVVLDKAKGES